MVTFLGLTWHVYGLILGLSAWLGWELVAAQARRRKISLEEPKKFLPLVIGAGVVGARVYHVITDWQLYTTRPWEALYIWQGGLSVIGAVIGGGLMLYLWLRQHRHLNRLAGYLDLSVFGIPLAQAFGRLGNYFNHELYGEPSTLPWAITIPPEFRAAGYETISRYHPLFAYEMIAMVGFGVAVWWLSSRGRGPQLGSGLWFAAYVAYYSLVRFGLDFLRLGATSFGSSGLTVNQVVMVILLVTAVFYIGRNYGKAQK